MTEPAYPKPSPGNAVRLETDHPRSNGKTGRVVSVEEWGCHLETGFGSGRYRAAWSEMLPLDVSELENPDVHLKKPRKAGHQVPTGDPCPNCQGVNMVRTGSCVTCQDCGHNEGCG